MRRPTPARALSTLAAAAALAACAQTVPVNVDRAQLMPDPVARQVLTKRISADWVNNPYFICGDGVRVRRPLSSIVAVTYDAAGQTLYICTMPWGAFCQEGVSGWVTVTKVTPDAAKELAGALVSLGASTGQ
jgi:hypothetical protein